MYSALLKKYDLKKKILQPDSDMEVKYLNRTIRWTSQGLELEGDQKHIDILVKEWGMQRRNVVDTPISKNYQDKVTEGERVDGALGQGGPPSHCTLELHGPRQGRPVSGGPGAVAVHGTTN